MADITDEIRSILWDVMGEAVRGSVCSAARKLAALEWLPEVTAADEGKILTVSQSGEWKAK